MRQKVVQILLTFLKCVDKCDFNTSEDDAQHGTSSYCLKTKVKLTFLLSYHHGDTNTAFQLKLANFLATQLPFMIV